MFLSFGDKQASKEVRGKEEGQTPESYTPLGVENSQCCDCKNSGFRENISHSKGIVSKTETLV